MDATNELADLIAVRKQRLIAHLAAEDLFWYSIHRMIAEQKITGASAARHLGITRQSLHDRLQPWRDQKIT